jgi:hypothetical protein
LGRRLKSTLLEAIQRLERRCSAGCLMARRRWLWIGAQAGLPVLLKRKGCGEAWRLGVGGKVKY